MPKRRPYSGLTPEQEKLIRDNYATMTAKAIGELPQINKSKTAIVNWLRKLGLRKHGQSNPQPLSRERKERSPWTPAQDQILL
jgi:hypothetical protein